MSDLGLNPAQQNAVTHGDGPMMVLAGPGSGKTTVITHRVRFLIEELLVQPEKILVITFTKSATDEMRKRFLELGAVGGERVTFCTFHALFFRIIRTRYRFGLENTLQEYERKEVVRRILSEANLAADDDFLAEVLNEISWIKNDLIDVQFFHSMSLGTDEFQLVYDRYEQYKKQADKLDFDDMLQRCHALFMAEPDVLRKWQDVYHYILIDEFQDINQAQYRCVTLLAESRSNLFIVGDDDQSIYKFRGARPEFLLRFPDDFSGTAQAVLDINYRSSDPIIAFCNQVISRNNIRYSKKMTGTGRDGALPFVLRSDDGNAEAITVAHKIKELQAAGAQLRDIAVVYRVNMQSRALADALMNAHIPYQIKDEVSSIYEHWIAKDIGAYLKISTDRDDNSALARIVNKPARYIHNTIVAAALKKGGRLTDNLQNSSKLKIWQRTRVESLISFLDQIMPRSAYDAVKYIRQIVDYDKYILSYSEYRKINAAGLYEILDEIQEAAKPYESVGSFAEHMQAAAMQAKEKKAQAKRVSDPNADLVLLSTMHSVKGLEFDNVFVVGAVEGSVPYEKSKTEAEIEEERRLFYVGITRAKSRLFISLVRNRHEKAAAPTRFLNGILWKEPKESQERKIKLAEKGLV